MKRRAFTLIELLVVIAIISILAAILFPVFARARESARRASYLSNLKQMGLATMQYIQDYDEFYPPQSHQYPTLPPDGNYWYSGSTTWFWPQILYPYHKSVQVFYCPSSNRQDEAFPRNGHYGASRAIFPEVQSSGTYTAVSTAAIVSPASTYMLMDSGTFVINAGYARSLASTNYYLPGMGAAGGTCNTSSANAKADCESGRHFGGVNMAFADGHTKWLKSSVVVAEARKCGTSSLCAAYHSAWNPVLDNS